MIETHAPAILVVEDDPALCDLVVDLLHGEGYNVEVARDGLEAIAALRDRRRAPVGYGLVLLDMMLPRANGIDVLRAVGDEVPVVAMSADRSKLSDALAAGARTVVPKPFEIERLIGAVARNWNPSTPG